MYINDAFFVFRKWFFHEIILYVAWLVFNLFSNPKKKGRMINRRSAYRQYFSSFPGPRGFVYNFWGQFSSVLYREAHLSPRLSLDKNCKLKLFPQHDFVHIPALFWVSFLMTINFFYVKRFKFLLFVTGISILNFIKLLQILTRLLIFKF